MIDRAGLLARAAAAAQVLVVDLRAPAPGEDDLRHLERVLRLRDGEAVSVVDGTGAWRMCAWREGGALEPTTEVAREPAATPEIAVGFSLPKGDRPEWIVQKLTELGVDRIEPLVTDRTVVRWDGPKAARNIERLRRIAYEAAMQCRRVRLPIVSDLAPLAPGGVLAHAGGDRATLRFPRVVVGPEGGWSQNELVTAAATIDLGPTVLRAETAAVTLGARLCALRADLTDCVASVKPDGEADTVRASEHID